jgi:hypothetical protein
MRRTAIPRTQRRTRAAGALLLACAVTGLAAGPAQAAEYRYWSFWDGKDGKDGSWAYAAAGPSSTRPDDGAVEGFRFTVSADSAAAGKPRTAPDFDAICHGTPAEDGTKRVGVVIDFGTAADAPDGEKPPKADATCAQVPEDATAGDALAAVAGPLRYDSGALLCAIDGYPESGCGDQVGGSGGRDGSKDPGAKDPGSKGPGSKGPGSKGPGSSEKASPGAGTANGSGGSGGGGEGPSAGLLGGVAAVVVLGAGAVWQARRRRG